MVDGEIEEDNYSLDRWDGELNIEDIEVPYREVLKEYGRVSRDNLYELGERIKHYKEDIIALMSFPIHSAMEEYTDIFQPGSEIAPLIDNAFHFTLAYGITGALYDGMNELEDLAERRGWERVENHLSNDANKIRWAFGVLNLLGTGKEFFDSAIDPGDVVFNNIGFLARTKMEFDIEMEDVYEEFSSGVLPEKLSREKSKF